MDRFCKGAQDKKDFLRQIRYIEVDFEKPHIEKLKAELDEIEEEFRCGPNKLIYLSTPPVLFDKITDWLGNITDQQGWNRVIYEKPFGEDLQTATTLNRKVRKTFSEEQIYRIDHYLGKELVQNILVLRFGNSLLENIWNKENIDSIRIIISEKVGVETRAGYYDKMGAIKDMVQNHMLQLLALTAMEQPVSLSAKHIRDKKVDVLKKVQLPHKDAFIRGQYSKGNSDSNEVESYRTDIEHTSDTETFVAFRTFVDNERWKEYPFTL